MRVSVLPAVPALAVVAAVATAACSTTDPSASSGAPDPIGANRSAIIGGQNDTTHEAVVAILSQEGSQGGLCSGTIVKIDKTRHIGWVLTAAHCVKIPPTIVVQTDDITSPTALQYQILDFTADTRYDKNSTNAAQPYDFAVIRITGVDETTPVIPIAGASDGVGIGTTVTMVGFGKTKTNAQDPNEQNTIRHSIDNLVGSTSLTGFPTGTILRYDQSSGGTCQGDSGGPDLVGTAPNEKVVGVHSFVEGDCDQASDSGRVSGDLSYINGELSKAIPADSCILCTEVSTSGKQACAQINAACITDAECKAYYDCVTPCGGSTSCRDACGQKHPLGEGPFNAAANCPCQRDCVAQCGSSLSCKGTPKCGYKFDANDCTTCTESSCCQEALDCGADGQCYQCLKTGDADDACSTNAARKKLATCVATTCADACAGNPLVNGADPPSGDGANGDSSGGSSSSGCSVVAPRARTGTGSGSTLALLGAALGVALMARRRR